MTDISSLYISNNELETALYFLKKGNELSPSNTNILYEIAFCYEQKEDLKHSEETYHQIIKIDPFSYEAWFNLGQVYFTNKEYRKAIQAYDYAMAISEDDSMTILQRAHSYFHIREYQKAIDGYLEYSEMTGEEFEPYMGNDPLRPQSNRLRPLYNRVECSIKLSTTANGSCAYLFYKQKTKR